MSNYQLGQQFRRFTFKVLMVRIFISYRRNDSIGIVGRIYDRLASHFGGESVFIDVDAIPAGVDFRRHLDRAVSKCDVLLAIIGDKWLENDQKGKRRLDNPGDFVRIEIETALARKIPVIPVLIGQATMPGTDELPSTLTELLYRQAMQVDPGRDFHVHMDRLIRELNRLLSRKNHVVIGVGMLLVTVIAVGYFALNPLQTSSYVSPPSAPPAVKYPDPPAVKQYVPPAVKYPDLPAVKQYVPPAVEYPDRPAVKQYAPPAVKPEYPDRPAIQGATGGYWVLQAGSFRNYVEADKLKTSIAFLGIRARIETTTGKDGNPLLHRVLIGPIRNADEAKALQRRLQENNIITITIKVPPALPTPDFGGDLPTRR